MDKYTSTIHRKHIYESFNTKKTIMAIYLKQYNLYDNNDSSKFLWVTI